VKLLTGILEAAFMILGILIFGNLVMRTRLPTRKRGTATMHAAVREDQITKLQPNDIPKVNHYTFFNPAYCFTTAGAAMVMMGITLPVWATCVEELLIIMAIMR
jgi:hypothetical protein